MESNPDPDRLSVTVVRSGGIAGLRREWRTQPAEAERAQWRSLLSACDWDAAPEGPAAGADRFRWRVEVRDGGHERAAEVGDSALDDGWRRLIDAVRAASG